MDNIRRLLVCLAVAVNSLLTASAGNSITLSTSNGSPGSEVKVTASMTMTDVVSAVEVKIPLGNQTKYVEGSFAVNSARINGHQSSAAVVDGTLRVYIYSMTLANLQGASGELFSFKVKLGNEPGNYTLTPTVMMSNGAGTSVSASAAGTSTTIVTPKLQATESIDYGRVAIRGNYQQTITLQNTGTSTLSVTGINSSTDKIVASQQSFTIAAGGSKNITLTYSPLQRGSANETVTIVSNAINGSQKVKVKATPYSVNELHVTGGNANSDEEVEVKLTMNNMEPIVGAQCKFTLPSALEYVEGSLKVSSRANGFVSAGAVNGQTLSLYLYSATKTPMTGNDGEIATFKVRLNGTSGWYSLTPTEVILANATEENMTSATSGDYVVIKSPTIACNSSIDMGATDVTKVAKQEFTISNQGQSQMEVSRITFLAEGYSILESLPLTISAGSSKSVTVCYQGAKSGNHSTTMNIYTNDPDNRMKTVSVSGSTYEPNSFSMTGAPSDDGRDYTIDVSLNNYTEIVAAQMDIVIPTNLSTAQSDLTATSRLANHSCSITKMDETTYRVVIYSMANVAIAGNSGKLFSLKLHGDGSAIIGKPIQIKDIVLSSEDGKNYSSQNIFAGTVEAQSVTKVIVNKHEASILIGQQETLSASVEPSNATEKAISWTSSNSEVASVTDAGVVSAIAVGDAIIYARAKDGSGKYDSCKVKVEPILVTAVALNKKDTIIVNGSNLQLTATISPTNATNKTVTWGSTASSIASVDNNGLVTAKSVGTAKIYVASTDGSLKSDTCVVTVTPILVSSVALNKHSESIVNGSTLQLTATVSPNNAANKALTWGSTASSIASVDNNGLVTAKSVGSVKIMQYLLTVVIRAILA